MGPSEANQLEQILSSSKVYVLLFGLSIHSFFEGLVIGLEGTRWSMWTLIMVVLLHKSLVALALGISAFRVFLEIKDAFFVMLIFGVASPVGVLCGGALKEMLVIKHDTRIILGDGMKTGKLEKHDTESINSESTFLHQFLMPKCFDAKLFYAKKILYVKN